MPRYPSYIICTSPRSGSTLLCGLLAATGQSGAPDSHFHAPSVARWVDYYGLSETRFVAELDRLRAVFAAAQVEGRGDTGIFGLRVQQHSFGYLMQKIAVLHPGLASDVERLEAAFGPTLFIHLSRKNKLEQAISFVKASQSGLWHIAPDGTEVERLAPPADPVYDAGQIAKALADLTVQEAAWESWFATEGITPLRVTYDALSENPAAVLSEVLQQLGLDTARAKGIRPNVAKLADATSRDWAERFLATSARQAQ